MRTDIAGIADMKAIAEMISELNYESLAELMNNLHNKFNEDYFKSVEEGKIEISKGLFWIYHAMNKASYGAERLCKISKELK